MIENKRDFDKELQEIKQRYELEILEHKKVIKELMKEQKQISMKINELYKILFD